MAEPERRDLGQILQDLQRNLGRLPEVPHVEGPADRVAQYLRAWLKPILVDLGYVVQGLAVAQSGQAEAIQHSLQVGQAALFAGVPRAIYPHFAALLDSLQDRLPEDDEAWALLYSIDQVFDEAGFGSYFDTDSSDSDGEEASTEAPSVGAPATAAMADPPSPTASAPAAAAPTSLSAVKPAPVSVPYVERAASTTDADAALSSVSGDSPQPTPASEPPTTP